MASMQITAAASRAQKSSRSPGRGGVAASSQPIRAMSQARTTSTYTMSDVGMASSGQPDGHLISRRRARSVALSPLVLLTCPLPIMSQDDAAEGRSSR
jgi:hypothetical protein